MRHSEDRTTPRLRTLALAAIITIAGLTAPHADRPRVYALTGGKIIVSPGHVIESGTIVLRDGIIEAVGADVKAPDDAVVVDAKGKTIHAGFIDACSDIGVKAPENGGAPGPGASRPARTETPAGAGHSIARVHPEKRVLDQLVLADNDLERQRGFGFTAALAVPNEGIFRGTSALITLGSGPVSKSVVRADVAQHVAFETGGFRGGYPGSLMGVIAVIRQTFEDAKRHDVWQARYDADPRGMKRPDTVSAYAPLSLAASAKIPVVFDATTPANVLRALALAREYNLDAMVVGSGADDEVLDGIKAAGRPVIVSMAFPDKPEIDDADEALDATNETLRRYVSARADAGRLAAAGVPIAIGTCRMKNVSEFPDHLRKAIAAGLTEDAALAALTVNPAKLYGVDRSMGTIEAGKAADVVVEEGPLFAEKTKPSRVYVDGVEYLIEQKQKGDPNAKVDPRGTWSVTVSFGSTTVTRTWTIAGKEGAYEGTAETREGTVSFTSMTLTGNELKIVQPSPRGGSMNIDVVITGDSFEGEGETGGGQSISLKGSRTSGPGGGSDSAARRETSCHEEEGGTDGGVE